MPLGSASFADDFRSIRRFAGHDHAAIVSWNEYGCGKPLARHAALTLTEVTRRNEPGH